MAKIISNQNLFKRPKTTAAQNINFARMEGFPGPTRYTVKDV